MIDSSKRQPDNRHLFDPVGLINSSYERPARRATATRSPNNFAGGGASPLRFAVERESGDGGDSDASSPRLWKTPTRSPSPDSRAQAIARGRREMMEMIKDMPESTFELSLRDIVDQKPPSPSLSPSPPDNSKSKPRSEKAISRSGSKKKAVTKSRSIDSGGFLLKTSVFPISFWLKKKKKSKKNSGSIRKSGVSSETETGEISARNGSSSSSSSSSSTVSRQTQGNRFLPDCLYFKTKK